MTAMLPIALVRHGNDFEAMMTEVFLPLAVDRLYSNLTMARLVDVDASDESKGHGEKVRVALPMQNGRAKDHPTDNVGSVSSDMKGEKTDIELDSHLYDQNEVTDRDFSKHANEFTLPSALMSSVDALAEAVNFKAHGGYKDVYNVSGDPSNLANRDKADIIEARKALALQKISSGQMIVLHPDTEADMLLEFSKINESGDADVVTNGLIGRKYGFNLYSDIHSPYHISGTASANNGITLASVAAQGSTVLTLSGTAGATFNKGDILYIAGSPQSYVVSADATGNAVQIFPALVESAPAGSAIRVLGDHPVDLAFHKSASRLVFRRLETPNDTPGVSISTITHPKMNLPLRMTRWYEPRTQKSLVKLDMLCGFKMLVPERAVRVGKV